MLKCHISERMTLAPFYEFEEVVALDEPKAFEEGLIATFFAYDLLHEAGYESYQPWKQKQELILPAFVLWKKEKESIRSAFAARKVSEVKKPMLQFTANFLSLMYWLNGKPVNNASQWKNVVASFSYKPVNIEERFEFILMRPAHHHAFTQLEQLYTELEKQAQKCFIYEKKA
ncbi:hypothetical protein LC040_09280 [Bacillus tianshenii]|nr:hypothetical protein LC040_09280 [Bacillus tianshenii]